MFVLSLPIGKICDEDGNKLPPNSPPPVHSAPQHSSDDWFPYESCVQFELADFLYRHNQMSQGDTDILLNLINAMLTSHGDHAPFKNHSDMHNTIDATTLGKAPWDHFTLSYNGLLPKGVSREDILGWMTEEHEVWFHNPMTLLENLLSNPNFKDEFDYTPYQEHTVVTSILQLHVGELVMTTGSESTIILVPIPFTLHHIGYDHQRSS